MKKFKGFTLIELIVVIAIIGVLCAILVPTMMGWVTKSRVKTNNANAKQTFTAAQEAITDADNHGWKWSSVTLIKSSEAGTWTAPTATGATLTSAQLASLTKSLNTAASTTSKWSVQINTSEGAKKAVFSANGSNYMGQYPEEIEETLNSNYTDLGGSST